MTEFYCGYCGGDVIYSPENAQYEHTDSGERITGITPGDFISARHNRAGTAVLAVDVQRDDERDAEAFSQDLLTDPIADSGGYLPCGCHGSQPEHTCKLAIEADRESAMRAEDGHDS